MRWFQMITIYVWHLSNTEIFLPDKWSYLFCPYYFRNILLFICIKYFNEDCSLKVSSPTDTCLLSFITDILYNAWHKHCDWEVFMYGRCLRFVYNIKLSQICIDLHTTDESTPAFCEVPGGLQEPGAVSKSLPLWRATSLGMTNNVHQHCSSYCFHFYSTLSSSLILPSSVPVFFLSFFTFFSLSAHVFPQPMFRLPSFNVGPLPFSERRFVICSFQAEKWLWDNSQLSDSDSSLPSAHTQTHTQQTELGAPIKETRPGTGTSSKTQTHIVCRTKYLISLKLVLIFSKETFIRPYGGRFIQRSHLFLKQGTSF